MITRTEVAEKLRGLGFDTYWTEKLVEIWGEAYKYDLKITVERSGEWQFTFSQDGQIKIRKGNKK